MKRIFCLAIFGLIISSSFAQKDLKIALNQTIVINFLDHIVYLQVLSTENKIKPKDDLYYFWFNANDIKVTRGGFDGKLLHGAYREFYLNKNLKEKGNFRYGLKHGEWKSWNLNGEYKDLSHWKKGIRHGKSKLYTEKGELIREEKYKKGVLKEPRNKRLFFFKKKEKNKEAKVKKEKENKPKKEKTSKKNTIKTEE
jgi:hypothetical protein